MAEALNPKSVSPFFREKYEKEARKYWDIFYKRNTNKAFKDRHYLHQEWGSYLLPSHDNGAVDGCKDGNTEPDSPAEVVLEVGCGAGNTVYPLLERNPDLFVHACDFSPRAVQLVKAHKLYDEKHVNAFVCDITGDDLKENVSPVSVDVAMLVFVLSAISPEKMRLAVRNIAGVLKPGGTVLLRDYASGDLAEKRFSLKESKIGESFYVRGDGTRAYYFTEEILHDLFASEGFSCQKMKVVERVIQNRARELVMHRRWIQAAFCLTGMASRGAGSGGQHLEVEEEPLTERERSSAGVVIKENVDGHEVSCGQGDGVCVHEEEEEEGEGDEQEKRPAAALAMTELFAEPLEYVERSVPIGDMAVHVLAVHPQCQHTTPQTGLLLWDSALYLSQLLALCPEVVCGRAVVELGAGGVGICAMAAVSARASLVMATDGDPAVVQMLRDSLVRNVPVCPGADRVHAERLRWGHPGDTEAVLSLSEACQSCEEERCQGQDVGCSSQGTDSGHGQVAAPAASEASALGAADRHLARGYDVVLGTDVVYVAKAVPKLFATARELLRRRGGSGMEDEGRGGGFLLLCHITRRVQEQDILNAAKQSGLVHRDLESVMGSSVAKAARQLGLNLESQSEERAEVMDLVDGNGDEGGMAENVCRKLMDVSCDTTTATKVESSISLDQVDAQVDDEERSSSSLFRLMCFTL